MTDIFSGPAYEPKPKPKAKPQPSRKKKRWIIALVAAGAAVLLVAGAAGVYAWTLSSTFDGKTEKIADVFPEDDAARPPVLEGVASKAQNILLLGSDTRGSIGTSLAEAGGARTDTIMVAHIPADRKNIYVMSIMRDSWLEIPGHGKAKVNAAMAFGGVPLAVSTIESLLGARIDHVAIVDFTGFKGVTNALGGVDVDNQVAFNSSHMKGHYFAQGTNHLNGTEALAFVRERYGFRDGDFQRARNQQAFIKAVLKTTLSAETLTDPGKISGLVGAVAPFLAVDEGLNSAYVAGLGVEMRDVRVGNVTFFTMPTKGTGTEGGQSVVNIDWDKLALVQEAFQTDTLDLYQPEVQTIG